MAQPARARRGTLTWRDFWHTPDDGYRYEIIDGEVYMSPVPYVDRQTVLRNLFVLLYAHVSRHRLGTVYFAPIGAGASGRSSTAPG
jgi:hypothetical protein